PRPHAGGAQRRRQAPFGIVRRLPRHARHHARGSRDDDRSDPQRMELRTAMQMDYGELVEELLRKRYFGKYRGTVVDNNDLLRLGRLKVSVNGLVDSGGRWGLPCGPNAGPSVGFHCLPPTGALVWVEFEGGDPSFPIWTGCMWANGDLPTEVLTADTRLLRTELAQITINDLTGEMT